MPVPKKRHTKSRRDKRRAHIKLEQRTLGICPRCAKPLLLHQACLNCGWYRGKIALDVFKKLEKRERKKKEKEIKEAEKKKPLSLKDLSKK